MPPGPRPANPRRVRDRPTADEDAFLHDRDIHIAKRLRVALLRGVQDQVAGVYRTAHGSGDVAAIDNQAIGEIRCRAALARRSSGMSIPRNGATSDGRLKCVQVRMPYGRRNTWPGLILSGSLNWSLFNSKIFM